MYSSTYPHALIGFGILGAEIIVPRTRQPFVSFKGNQMKNLLEKLKREIKMSPVDTW